jgi:hypothetical protein
VACDLLQESAESEYEYFCLCTKTRMKTVCRRGGFISRVLLFSFFFCLSHYLFFIFSLLTKTQYTQIMGIPDTEGDEGFLRGYKRGFRQQQPPNTPPPTASAKYRSARSYTQKVQPPPTTEKDEFSTAISWPIILAVIPTLGAFIAGSAEVWSDLIMILLILYYVYKWITG